MNTGTAGILPALWSAARQRRRFAVPLCGVSWRPCAFATVASGRYFLAVRTAGEQPTLADLFSAPKGGN